MAATERALEWALPGMLMRMRLLMRRSQSACAGSKWQCRAGKTYLELTRSGEARTTGLANVLLDCLHRSLALSCRQRSRKRV